MLRKHSVDDEPCGGAGLPAVGELSEIYSNTEMHGSTEIRGSTAAVPDPARPVTPVQQQRVASVA